MPGGGNISNYGSIFSTHALRLSSLSRRRPQGGSLTYDMVAGEAPTGDEDCPPLDEIRLLGLVTKEAFFVDFLRSDEYDEDGVRGPLYHPIELGDFESL